MRVHRWISIMKHLRQLNGLCARFRDAALVALASILLFGFSPPDVIDDGQPDHNPGLIAQRKADGLPFIHKLRWGMHREKIQKAFPEVEDLWIERGFTTKPNFRQLKVPHFVVQGCEFHLEMDFFNPPMDSLTELSGYYEGSKVEYCLNRITKRFVHDFGPHPWHGGGETYGSGGHTETTVSQVWSGRVTTIWLEVTKDLKSKKRRFRVTLQHTGAPGTVIE